MDGGARERIFLYGTLRRGGLRDVLKFYEDVEFVGPARVRGELYDLGGYPGLRLSAAGAWVNGEVFEVTPAALALLDEWEGIDAESPEQGEYGRIRMTVECADGGKEPCWGYEIALHVCKGRPVISSGDWIAHDSARR